MKKIGVILIAPVLCLTLCGYYSSATQVFHIKPDNGTPSACTDPCVTLNEYANMSTSSYKSVALVFLPGKHTLTMALVMENKLNGTLEAESSNVSIQCNNRGFLYAL